MRRLAATTATVITLFVSLSAQSGSPTPAAPAGQHSGHPAMTDADFAYLMARHHRGGIEMARMEEAAGANADVKALAVRIREAQEKELPELDAHGAKHKASAMTEQHAAEMQKKHQASMAKMKAAKGAALDRAFVIEMIEHHRGALEMIKQAQLKDEQLRAMADKMAESQREELRELQKHQNH